MLSSPFLKISMIKPSENKQPFDSLEKLNLPFSIIFKASSLNIIIPTLINQNKGYDNYELHFHFNCLMNLSNQNLSLTLNIISMYFSYKLKNIEFAPILSDFGLLFSITNSKCGLDLSLNIVQLFIKFSISDILLLMQIIESIQKTIESKIYTNEESIEVPTIQFKNVKFTSEKMQIILCRDNRSSDICIPIFRFTLPPISFLFARSSNVDSLMIKLEPFIEFFNDFTGSYDFLVEPFPISVPLILTENSLQVEAKIDMDLNINLPINSISQIINIVTEIKSNINHDVISYNKFPTLWIDNDLGVDITVNIEDITFPISYGGVFPILNGNSSSLIKLTCNGNHFTICAKDFSYPTYIKSIESKLTLCFSKSTYKGSLSIIISSPLEIENQFLIPLDIYILKNNNTIFNLGTICPRKRLSLFLESSEEQKYTLIPTDIDSSLIKAPFFFTMSYNDEKTEIVKIYNGNSYFTCVKSSFNDYSRGSKIFTIQPQYVTFNYLTYPIIMKFKNNETPIAINPNEEGDLLLYNNDIYKNMILTSFSTNGEIWSTTSVKMKFYTPQKINITNNNKTETIACLIENIDEERIKINIFCPCVFFNQSIYILKINEIELFPKTQYNYCPQSFFDAKPIKLRISIKNIAKWSDEVIDCSSSGSSTIFVPSLEKDLFIPITYAISQTTNTSIISFFSSIKIVNNTEYLLKFLPTNDIPTFNEDEIVKNYSSEIFLGNVIGDPIVCYPCNEQYIALTTLNGFFYLSYNDCAYKPIISIFEPKKTVIKIQDSFDLLELEVKETDTGHLIIFNHVQFPTPITIANQLDTNIFAFQFLYMKPQMIEPNSTSVFGFDEPLAYPSLHICFDKFNYNISLVDDTDYIEMPDKYKDNPIYIRVKSNNLGNRIVLITQTIEEEKINNCKFSFRINIPNIYISIIDKEMHEFALLKLSQLLSNILFNDDGKLFEFSINNIQIDDQNPLAQHPTLVYGRNTNAPFLSIQCLCAKETKLFSSFKFINVVIQRLDIELNSSFISDMIYIINTLSFPKDTTIKPTSFGKRKQLSLINIDWLEISPLYLVVTYLRKDSRPSLYQHIPSYFKYIPSINSNKIVLPGLFITHLVDRIESLVNKISGDYKTASFNKVIEMLGSSGTLLNLLHITPMIASKLNISLTSKLSEKINQFSHIEKEQYSNRRTLLGYFSIELLETLSSHLNLFKIEQTHLIKAILNKKNTGIEIRSINGYGFGVGIAGVITKTYIDLMRSLPSMSGTSRARYPRAYPENRISVYNNDLAKAQTFISNENQTNDQVKLALWSTNNHSFICFTNSIIYVLNNEINHLNDFASIKDVKNITIINESLKITFNNRKGLSLSFDRNAYLPIMLFLLSQIEMYKLFKKSLIK